MDLSILDLIPVYSHQTTADAIKATVGLVKSAESLGYKRYWIAEHHNIPPVAATNPGVILAYLAAHTHRIRLGSGGVMLPNHSPLVVAEQYALLTAMGGARIDLGIGRAPGADPITATALKYGNSDPQQFIADLRLIMSVLQLDGAHFTVQGKDFRLAATPRAESQPEMWLLGSTHNSAYIAAQLGMPYVFAYHFSDNSVQEALAIYRKNFVPGYLPVPVAMVTVCAIVADTTDQAERLAISQIWNTIRLRTGRPLQILETVEEVVEIPLEEKALGERIRRKWIIGDADYAAQQLYYLADELELSEIMIVPYPAASKLDDPATHPHRMHSLDLIARGINKLGLNMSK